MKKEKKNRMKHIQTHRLYGRWGF